MCLRHAWTCNIIIIGEKYNNLFQLIVWVSTLILPELDVEAAYAIKASNGPPDNVKPPLSSCSNFR